VSLLYTHLGPNQACFWLGHRERRRERAVSSEAAEQQQNVSIATAATLGLHNHCFSCATSPRRYGKSLLARPCSPIPLNPAAEGQAVLEAMKWGHKRSVRVLLHWAFLDPQDWGRTCTFLPIWLIFLLYKPSFLTQPPTLSHRVLLQEGNVLIVGV